MDVKITEYIDRKVSNVISEVNGGGFKQPDGKWFYPSYGMGLANIVSGILRHLDCGVEKIGDSIFLRKMEKK